MLIVGAGISGIGAARYLTTELPGTTYAVLEAREASGGTWDLFRYPGIRSDSDLHTFGYEFKPWRERKSIASAEPILGYLRETASEYGVDEQIRYHHKVLCASWSSDDARWTVHVERTDTGEATTLTCGVDLQRERLLPLRRGVHAALRGPRPLHRPGDPPAALARGPRLGGQEGGRHRQRRDRRDAACRRWPRRPSCVTMLQRTPTLRHAGAVRGRPGDLAAEGAAAPTGPTRSPGARTSPQQALVWKFCQRFPKAARAFIRRENAKRLPEGFPRRRALQPAVRPLDAAAVRRPRRRPVPGASARARPPS